LVVPAADILFVSKPLSPPWDDSGKLLPYLVARHLDPTACRVEVPVPRGRPLDLPGVASWPVYSRDSSFAVPRGDKVRLLASLLARRLPPVVHFFFSPNASTSLAARAVRFRHPRTRFVQTVMSLPADDTALDAGLFADVVIAWSAVAADRIRRLVTGRSRPPRVVHVPPGVVARDPLAPSRRDAVRGAFGLPVDRPVVLYAGDLEFSTAARTLAATIPEVLARVDATFVFACRPKTPAAAAALSDVRARLGALESSGRIRFLGNIPDFQDLLGSVDLQVLPADTTYAKTDLPLVVLEGLLAGVPAVVGRGTPMDELVDAGAVLGVPPSDAGALAATIADALGGPALAALARSGRAFALARHTAQAMACAHQALYREMLRSE
jgi:phosphatidylinositol alpha-1,6-mannosyltransferase